mgnify:CR=1 FL=1
MVVNTTPQKTIAYSPISTKSNDAVFYIVKIFVDDSAVGYLFFQIWKVEARDIPRRIFRNSNYSFFLHRVQLCFNTNFVPNFVTSIFYIFLAYWFKLFWMLQDSPTYRTHLVKIIPLARSCPEILTN